MISSALISRFYCVEKSQCSVASFSPQHAAVDRNTRRTLTYIYNMQDIARKRRRRMAPQRNATHHIKSGVKLSIFHRNRFLVRFGYASYLSHRRT